MNPTSIFVVVDQARQHLVGKDTLEGWLGYDVSYFDPKDPLNTYAKVLEADVVLFSGTDPQMFVVVGLALAWGKVVYADTNVGEFGKLAAEMGMRSFSHLSEAIKTLHEEGFLAD